MTSPTKSLPIPEHWTPEQAIAALDMLDICYDAIWNLYETPIVEHIMRRDHWRGPHDQTDDPLGADEDLDDDIPF